MSDDGRRRLYRAGALLAMLAGLGAMVALVAYQGFAQVGAALAAAGWGIALITAFHLVPVLAAAIGWHTAAGAMGPAGALPAFLWARMLREAVNGLLPVAQVGGNVIGARALALHGVRSVIAGASMLVDLTMEVAAQIVFIIPGIVILLVLGDTELAGWAAVGLALAALGVAGFVLVQRSGALLLLEGLFRRLADHFELPALASLDQLNETVLAIYRHRSALIGSAAWHTATWFLDVVETWITLKLLGAPVSFAAALVIESLGQAIRSAAFLVPGAYGVQEGGYMLLGTLFGLAPEVALSLSLIKRVRDVLLGVPAILVWQAVESRRLVAAGRAAAAQSARSRR